MIAQLDRRHRMSVYATDGILHSGKRMLAILVSMVRTRLNLLAVELIQEKSRIWVILVLTALALIFASMALLALSTLVVALFWDQYRLQAIGCLSLFYVLATIVTLIVLQRKAKAGSSLFAGTLSELSKDSAALAIESGDLEFDVDPRSRRD